MTDQDTQTVKFTLSRFTPAWMCSSVTTATGAAPAAPPRRILIIGRNAKERSTVLTDLVWHLRDQWDGCLAYASSLEQRMSLMRFVSPTDVVTNVPALVRAWKQLSAATSARHRSATPAEAEASTARVLVLIDALTRFPTRDLRLQLRSAQEQTVIVTTPSWRRLPAGFVDSLDWAVLLPGSERHSVKWFHQRIVLKVQPSVGSSSLRQIVKSLGDGGALVVRCNGPASSNGDIDRASADSTKLTNMHWWRSAPEEIVSRLPFLVGTQCLTDMAHLATDDADDASAAVPSTAACAAPDEEVEEDSDHENSVDTDSESDAERAPDMDPAPSSTESNSPASSSLVDSTSSEPSGRSDDNDDAVGARVDNKDESDPIRLLKQMMDRMDGYLKQPRRPSIDWQALLHTATVAAGTAFGMMFASHLLWG